MMQRFRRDERGVAMITSLLVGFVLTGLGLTVAQVSVSNLSNAGRDRVASGALGAAEAGVTRAIAFIKKNNTHALTCSPACPTLGWGNSTTPQTVSLPDGRQARVWIEKLQPYAPPVTKVGVYRIHSVGTSGSGPGKRTLQVTIEVRPLAFPLGIFTHDKINNGGTGSVTSESVFSDSCIDSRNNLTFTGIDAYYGIPAAAHSTAYITTANLSYCENDLNAVRLTDNKAVHRAAVGTCNSTYPYDRDSAPLGGPFPAGSACGSAPNQYTTSSNFDLAMLKADPFNYLPRGLTDAQYTLLRSRAQADGTYYTTTTPPSWPNATTSPNPILYFKLTTGQEVNIQTELNSYAWTSDASCALQHPAVVIVVEGGDLRVNSNSSISGAVFTPDGTFTYAGGAQLVGTLFAKQLKMTGNANISVNECYAKSTPGGVMEVKPIRFREVDRPSSATPAP